MKTSTSMRSGKYGADDNHISRSEEGVLWQAGAPFSFEVNRMIEGVGPNQPVVTTPQGGMHSASPYAFHLIDPQALFAIAKVLQEGAEKYGANNWRGIPIPDNLNHALQHIYAYLAGDTQDEHLAHAACRLIFALALQIGGEKD